MVTKKDIFLDLRNLIASNIQAVSNRVYSAFPKKKYVLPLIVIPNISRSASQYSIDSNPNIDEYNVEIEVYTKTAQECDEITDELFDLLKNNPVVGKKPASYGEIDHLEYVDLDNKIIHKKTIALVYKY